MYGSMSLLFSDVSSDRVIIGTFLAGFLCCFIPHCSKRLVDPYKVHSMIFPPGSWV